MIAEDMAGGEWEQHARHIYVESDGWIRGHHVPTAIHTVRNSARIADALGTKGALHQLNQALAKLEVEIERYQGRMRSLREQVGLLHALVLRSQDEAPEMSDADLEEQRRQRLLAETDSGIDDALIRRAAELHRRDR